MVSLLAVDPGAIVAANFTSLTQTARFVLDSLHIFSYCYVKKSNLYWCDRSSVWFHICEDFGEIMTYGNCGNKKNHWYLQLRYFIRKKRYEHKGRSSRVSKTRGQRPKSQLLRFSGAIRKKDAPLAIREMPPKRFWQFSGSGEDKASLVGMQICLFEAWHRVSEVSWARHAHISTWRFDDAEGTPRRDPCHF